MKRLLSIILCVFLIGCAGTIDPNKIVTDLYGLYVKWSQTTTPPAPTPTPTPTPAPTPIPIPPTPVPIPVPANIVIADLNLMPGRMRAEGFQGRDGVLLYSWGCAIGGRAWACNPTDTECTTLQGQEVAIAAWSSKYLTWVEDVLKLNPQTTATIIVGDAVDRFGFIIAPVIQQRLSAYSARINLGIVVPESAY